MLNKIISSLFGEIKLKTFYLFIILCCFTTLNTIFAVQNDIKVVKEKITFTTGDGFNISAIIGKPEEIDDDLPAVILIHQGGSDKSEWNNFFDQLVKQNYIVLAYDVRGHGESDKVSNVYALFNDPNQAPHDFFAAVEY